jgi:hypothetical protein
LQTGEPVAELAVRLFGRAPISFWSFTMNTLSRFRPRRRVAVLAAAAMLTTPFLGGCNNAGEGALTGAGLGALAGMGLGSLSGNMGKGAAAGAIIGGLGGLIIGDQNSRR